MYYDSWPTSATVHCTFVIFISYSYYLAQFERWYTQAGTPVLTAAGAYDAATKTYALALSPSSALSLSRSLLARA